MSVLGKFLHVSKLCNTSFQHGLSMCLERSGVIGGQSRTTLGRVIKVPTLGYRVFSIWKRVFRKRKRALLSRKRCLVKERYGEVRKLCIDFVVQLRRTHVQSNSDIKYFVCQVESKSCIVKDKKRMWNQGSPNKGGDASQGSII